MMHAPLRQFQLICVLPETGRLIAYPPLFNDPAETVQIACLPTHGLDRYNIFIALRKHAET